MSKVKVYHEKQRDLWIDRSRVCLSCGAPAVVEIHIGGHGGLVTGLCEDDRTLLGDELIGPGGDKFISNDAIEKREQEQEVWRSLALIVGPCLHEAASLLLEGSEYLARGRVPPRASEWAVRASDCRQAKEAADDLGGFVTEISDLESSVSDQLQIRVFSDFFLRRVELCIMLERRNGDRFLLEAPAGSTSLTKLTENNLGRVPDSLLRFSAEIRDPRAVRVDLVHGAPVLLPVNVIAGKSIEVTRGDVET